MFDNHMHSSFSADSSMSMSEILDEIKTKKIGVTLTEHMDLGFPGTLDFTFSPEDYFKTYMAYRNAAVYLGLECGLRTDYVAQNKALMAAHPFDLVIGSIHVVEGIDLCNPLFYKGRTKEQSYALYFDKMAENIELLPEIDVLGHMDYIARYSPYEMPEIDYEVFQTKIDRVLQLLVKHDIALELNTRRLGDAKAVDNLKAILSAYHAFGGQWVSLGSDAHDQASIGSRFEIAQEMVRAANLTTVYFINRERQVVKE